MTAEWDAVVVGAGVVGSSCAAELAAKGLKVVVLEKGSHSGWEGSSRSMGSLRIQGRIAPELPLAVEGIARWKALTEVGDFEFVQGGNIYVAQTQDEVAMLLILEEQAHAVGLTNVRVIDASEACRLVPFRQNNVSAALYSPYDAQCNPQRAVELMVKLAESRGACFKFNQRVAEITVRSDGSVRGVRMIGNEFVDGPVVVVAAGLGTSDLVRTVGLEMPISGVLVTQAETERVSPLFQATLRASNFSVRQRPTGQLVLGGGLNIRADKIVSLRDLRQLRKWLPRYRVHHRSVRLRLGRTPKDWRHVVSGEFGRDGNLHYLEPNRRLIDESYARLRSVLAPEIDSPVRRYWTGFIDQTLDGLPVVDQPESPQGLVIAGGFSGHGLTIAPTIGLAVAEMMTTRNSQFDLRPFRLARFQEPNIKIPERFI